MTTKEGVLPDVQSAARLVQTTASREMKAEITGARLHGLTAFILSGS